MYVLMIIVAISSGYGQGQSQTITPTTMETCQAARQQLQGTIEISWPQTGGYLQYQVQCIPDKGKVEQSTKK